MFTSLNSFYRTVRNYKCKISREMLNTDVDLSIIIPTFNEAKIIEQNLRALSEKIKAMDISVELIVADDGSTDGTPDITEKLPGVSRVLRLRHAGKGHAVKEGMLASRGSWRIFYDADFPFGFDILDKILYHLIIQEHDVVIGIRKDQSQNMTNKRFLISKIFNFIVDRIVIAGLDDTQCGLKGFSAEVANTLFTICSIHSMAFDVEILYAAWKKRMSIYRMLVELTNVRSSKWSIKRVAPGMFLDLIRIKMNHIRGRYK